METRLTKKAALDAKRDERIDILQEQLAAMTRERDEAKEKVIHYDRWLSNGVYFTSEEYQKECKENNAVKAQLERELDDAQLLVQLSLETAEHRMALQLQVAELTKDAMRYRMLRRGQHWSVINGIGDILRGDELDAAIDEAMK